MAVERVNELGGQVAGWRKRQSGSKQLKGGDGGGWLAGDKWRVVGRSNCISITGENDGYGFAVRVRVMLETEK